MRLLLSSCLLLFAACAKAPPAATPAPQAPADPLRIEAWTLPVAEGAQPDLVEVEGGGLLLSWLEKDATGHALKFAKYDGRSWSAPTQIARGDDWFVNWADTPHVLATADGALWAHWLRQSAAAKYAYDVVLSRSGDGGMTWSLPLRVNQDGTPTEHGFVSLWAASRDTLGIAWLDGRAMAGGMHGHDGGTLGAMSLRAAVFDAHLQRAQETELDPRTCDCCQTDAALTSCGPLLVYRDRDGAEVRDIVVTRFDKGAWTLPRKVHDDRWTMPACPVNGPAVAARGEDAWIGWYTAAGEVPRVRMAHSEDAGDSFSSPIEIDSGAQVQGRVGVAREEAATWINWTREDAQGQSLWLARLEGGTGQAMQRIQVARLAGRGRATGFPQMVATRGVTYLVWTDVVAGKPVLRGARVRSN